MRNTPEKLNITKKKKKSFPYIHRHSSALRWEPSPFAEHMPGEVGFDKMPGTLAPLQQNIQACAHHHGAHFNAWLLGTDDSHMGRWGAPKHLAGWESQHLTPKYTKTPTVDRLQPLQHTGRRLKSSQKLPRKLLVSRD